MSDRDTESGQSSRLLRGLSWAGVVLAPLAAAIVLLGQSSGSVRFAVLLIAASVVLIGAAVLIRHDPVLQRMHVEDRVAEEVSALRSELRAEFARGAPGGPSRGGDADSGFARGDADSGLVRSGSGDPARRGPADNGFPRRPAESSFFGDDPMLAPSGDDGFPTDPFPGDPFPGEPLPADPFPGRPADDRRPSAPGRPTGGRASVPAAVASARAVPAVASARAVPAVASARAVPPPPAREPGMSTGGRERGTSTGGREPGLSTGGREPGMPTGGRRPVRPAGERAPGRSTGSREPQGRPVAGVATASAAVPPILRQRGSASVPMSAQPAVSRASAAVRPGGTHYGRPDSLDDDFGASDGYSGSIPISPLTGRSTSGGAYGSARVEPYGEGAGHGSAAEGTGTYGSPADGLDAYGSAGEGHDAYGSAVGGYGSHGSASSEYDAYGSAASGHRAAGDDYGQASDAYGNGYGQTGLAADDFGAASGGFPADYGRPNGYGHADPGLGEELPDVEGYGLIGGYDGSHPQSGDPHYRARRHRPSANDTNVGSLEDFASYRGWPAPAGPDERYVQGYGPSRR